ncbi:MAG: integrin alpha [Anaerolineae bacterium]|jgi:hypothetical protein|nr:integrin alpha [Anaerolineae bacterium]
MKMSQLWKTLVALVLVVASLEATPHPKTSIAAPIGENPAPTSDELKPILPSGVSGDWWATVQENIRQSEYEVTWQDTTALSDLPSAYQAPNRAQNLRSYFDPNGLRLIPRQFEGEAPPWEFGLTLSRYTAGEHVVPLAAAELAAVDNRMEYQRDALIEWYINDERGLEQGFTLLKPSQPATGEQIVLDLALSGNLTPRLVDDGRAVEFTTAGGVTVLRYADLAVWDSAGNAVPAWLALSEAGIQIHLDATGAGFPITVDPLLSTHAWTAESNDPGAYFGHAVGTAGDVNGDGYSDVIVGAYYYDAGSGDAGAVFVYHGSPNGLSTSHNKIVVSAKVDAYLGISVGTAGDVNGDGYSDVIAGAHNYDTKGRAFVYYGSASGIGATHNWFTESDQTKAQYGWSVGTAGDVNGDGYADVIVGARYYPSSTKAGRAFMYCGSSSGLSTTLSWSAESDQNLAQFGWSVGTAGDVNGDGYADVIVGAPYYNNGQDKEGRIFVYHGSGTGLSTNADWTAEGEQASAMLGFYVATAGDVNGDGYTDIIGGADTYSTVTGAQEGAAFAWYGSPSGLGLSGTPTNADWSARGSQSSSHFGSSVGVAGDVNGDGYADVIVGACLYSNGQTAEGRAFVYHGSALGLSATANWTAESDQAEAQFGCAVSTAGDVNGDGYADVLIGARLYDGGQSDEGRAYVYHGAPAGLSATAGWTAEGNQTDAYFGVSVGTAGDVNGDGYADVIVGARDYDSSETNEGRAFVYYGSATGPSATADWTAEGNQVNAWFGRLVSTAGDVNGDGYGDIVIGAPSYDGKGAVFVYHGSASGLGGYGTPDNADWKADSDQSLSYFGASAGAAGDVNGDGYSDVIIGAYGYDNDQTDEGRAFVWLGSASGLNHGIPGQPANAAWMAEGDQINAQFGIAVGTAGDVNGDGYADVIVGAWHYSNVEGSEGRAFVYHGSATGLSVTANWTAESNQANADFGVAVGTAGDVNGDGYADVIIGAYQFDNGQADEGAAFVWHGSSNGINNGTHGTPANASWSAESNQISAYFGYSAGTAGDVNGDGYDDVGVGAYAYNNGQTDEGMAFVWHGSVNGINGAMDGDPINAAWKTEGNQNYAQLGNAVGTAGDVNGDGYADVIIGAQQVTNGQTREGRAYLFYGNGGDGLEVIPRQRRADDSAPVAPGGQSTNPTGVRLAALARMPLGRGQVRFQWEIKPEGVAFDGTGLGQSTWQDSGTAGYAFDELVGSLTFETRYHWRARIMGRPANAASSSAITYRSRWFYGSTLFTALSGKQSIGSTGRVYLLDQASYVEVTTQGTLSELTMQGYPQTAHPHENDGGLGTQMLDRYFTLTPNTGASDYDLTLCLNYDDAETAGLDENDLQLCRWTGTTYACLPRSASSNTALNLACAEDVTEFSDWVITGGNITAVELARFEAWQSGEAALVIWETATELDNLGFNLYRSATPAGPWSQVNAELIPAQNPGSVFGAVYEVLDTAVMPDRLTFYHLEDVDIHGASTFHGPISITLSAPAVVRVRSLAAQSAPGLGLGMLLLLVFALVVKHRR